MKINELIKKRRIKLGLSQKDIATVLKVSTPTYSRFENGSISNIGIDKVDILIETLECSPDYLFSWEKDSLVLSPHQKRLIQLDDKLNKIGKKKLMEYASDMNKIEKYKGLSSEDIYALQLGKEVKNKFSSINNVDDNRLSTKGNIM